MLASLRRACSRALGGGAVLAALLMSACGGGEPSDSLSSSSGVTVAGADGASVTFDKRFASPKTDVTVRVARDASGAPPLPANVVAVGGVYAFTPLGQLAPGAEIRIPFDAGAVPRGSRLQLLASAPGEPWLQVLSARVEGSTVVARVARLSHAVVVASAASGSGVLAKLTTLRAGDGGDASSPSLSLTVASATPPLGEPIEEDGTTLVGYSVQQPTQMTLRLNYTFPETCVSPRHVELMVMGGDLDADGQVINQRMSVVASVDAPSASGQLEVPQAFAAGRHEVEIWVAQANCRDQDGYQAFFGVEGVGFLVDTRSTPASAPVITTQPQSQNVVEGDAVTFAVQANDATAYQWQRSNDGGQTYSPVGQNSSSVSVTTTLADNASLWRVLASNSGGTTTSSVARLSVSQRIMAPVVTSDPANQTVVEGETASFTVVGTGTPAPIIEWQVRGAAVSDPEAGWSTISGVEGATYTTGVTTLAQSGTQYRAVLRNSGGSAVSLPAALTVGQRLVAPSIRTSPVGQTVEEGQLGAFFVAADGSSPLSYQWFKNGQAIVGATAAEVAVLAQEGDAGTSYQITVEVSNAAGRANSVAATMTITARPISNPGTLVSAAVGGALTVNEDTSLVLPPGSLLSDTVISAVSIPNSGVVLPDGMVAQNDPIEIGPAGLVFAQPVTLVLPVPDVLPADKVWALVELDDAAQASNGAVSAKRGTNIRRVAKGMYSAGRTTLAAAVNAVNVQCADGQSSRGGKMFVDLQRAARYITVAAPQLSCTSGTSRKARPLIPSTTTATCRDAEFLSDSLGNEVLLSRHVHCATNETDIGWMQDERGNYGFFRLAWRVGSDGPAKGLNKTYRLKFLLTRVQAPDANPVSTPLTLDLRAVIACASQQYSGSCSTSGASLARVTAGSGWSSEILIDEAFSWTGGDDTWNDFVFSHINIFYKMPSQVGESTLQISGPPRIRCDKRMAVNGGEGCVYPEAPAVLVLSSSDLAVREAAEHIKDVQVANGIGELKFDNEGRWTVSGSRPLQRTRVSGLKGITSGPDGANRITSCLRSSPSSIIRMRPANSNSCPADGAGCDCDEYPFNSTWNGAWLNKDETSAKYINSAQNQEAGRRVLRFYHSERVLDLTADPGIAYSPGNESVSIPPRLGGDDFWVHIEP